MVTIHSKSRELITQFGIALVYFILACIALEFSSLKEGATLLWPSSGFALVVLLKYGARYSVGVFLGAYAAGLYMGGAHTVSLGTAIGNTLEPILTVSLLRLFPFSFSLYRLYDYLSLLLAASIGAIASAILGPLMLTLAGIITFSDFPITALHWWMADILGIILVAPFLLLFHVQPFIQLLKEKYIETSTLILFSLIIASMILAGWHTDTTSNFIGSYLLVVPLAWSILRFNHIVTVLITFIYFVIGILGLLLKQGIFIDSALQSNLILFWMCFIVIAVISLVISYAVSERDGLFQAINDSKIETFIFSGKDLRFEFISRAALDNLGLTLAEALKLTPLDITPLYSRKNYSDLLIPLAEQQESLQLFDTMHQRKDGTLYPVQVTLQLIKHSSRQNYLASVTDLSQQIEKEKLNLLAYYDFLTKLPNRALFIDRFKQAVAHSKRTKSMLAICFLDIDNFKLINDNYGHDSGDQLLIEVAKRIKDTIREEDTVSRQGGDEFTLILREIETHSQCEQLLDRIRLSLAKPYIINEQSHHLTASIGATIYPRDDAELDTLIRHADNAMYQAKTSGKNQYLLFNTLDDKQSIDKRARLQEIEQALANKEFQLYFQPKVNMRTGVVFGAEALIRWFHPKKGMIPPLDFLPLLDGTDLEVQIGGWVINEALQQLDRWKEQGLDLELSINVSSHHLQSPIFLDQLNGALDRHPNVDSQDLQLEILESSVLSDIEIIKGIIQRCQNVLGITVALDDFGTGYSSLTHLRNLPASVIKIDQSFVRNMLESSEDLALIEGIISLAKTFDRDVIAEGVETAEHGILLMRIGCNCAQGYGIAKPMPADKIIEWTRNYKPAESWSIWSGSEWEMSNLPLVVAQQDHISWIQDIFTALEGRELTLSHHELTDHHQCRLGQWYDEHGLKYYGDLPGFREFESIHKNVHSTGHKIIQLYNEGRKEEAVLLSKELLSLKSKVLESLNSMQQQVNFI
jgi:diguanylate cyclase (GGDEF)-like protein/PAS domain S-box-containing protein